jgi:DNA-directed RNA polymerase specialized sigma24 family protein
MNRAATASVEKSTMGIMPDHIFTRPVPVGFAIQGASEVFDDWFSRCYGPLHFIACRILGSPKAASLAVQNCWLTASRNPPAFDRESEFRSWLLRVLIDEALAILRDPLRTQVDAESQLHSRNHYGSAF